MGKWNHRLEKYVGNRVTTFGFTMDCNYLSRRFPFRDSRTDTISVDSGNTSSRDELKVFPWKAAAMSSMWSSISTLDDRHAWSKIHNDSKGQDLTDSLLKKINQVEIDNSISLHASSCKGPQIGRAHV